MTTVNPPTAFKKTHKIATMTALAAAFSMMFAVPAIAAETAPAPEATTVTDTAPSAIDSSKRVVRRASATTSAASTPESTDVIASQGSTPAAVVNVATEDDVTVAAPAVTILKPLPIVFAQKPTTGSAVQASGNAAPQPVPVIQTGNDIRNSALGNIPVPQASIANVTFVPTVIIAQKRNSDIEKLDVSLLDDFITETSPNARHYPPNFPNRTQRYTAREKIKVFTDWIDPYAKAPDASYDILLRAAKLNGMGRNLDLGSEYTVRGGTYIDRALKINPNSAEANFLYGMMLSEGGGFKEGQKYLDRAVALGYTEAEQSLAQSDVLSDRRSEALERLRRLEKQYPNNTIIPQQIKLVEEGKYYIWDLSGNTNAKPIT